MKRFVCIIFLIVLCFLGGCGDGGSRLVTDGVSEEEAQDYQELRRQAAEEDRRAMQEEA